MRIVKSSIIIGACFLTGSAFAAGMGGGGHMGGAIGGGMSGGHMGGGAHIGGGAFHAGSGAGFAARGFGEQRAFHDNRFGFRRGGVIGGAYGYPYGGYDYGYNDPAYGYGENGDGVVTGRSAAEDGSACQTRVTSCELPQASFIGQPCACEGKVGRVVP